MPTSRVPGLARVALAAIRIVNGSAALVAPAPLARHLGVRRDDNQAVQYVFRMFGIRTVVIHASDTASAALAGITRQIPARPALIVTSISALNTVLALTAYAGQLQAGAAT